jgi:hypothetical protein
VSIGFFNDGLASGETALIIVALGNAAHYTVRTSQQIAWPGAVAASQWKPWTNLETETSYSDGGSINCVSVARRPFLA